MRIGKIELMRFLGAVLIMNAHFGYQDRPFQLSWFFVEFFYIITGYFTMRHFEKQEPQEHFEAVKIAVEYTGKKFVQFLPYTTGAILITYIAMNWHYIGEGAFGNFIRSLKICRLRCYICLRLHRRDRCCLQCGFYQRCVWYSRFSACC